LEKTIYGKNKDIGAILLLVQTTRVHELKMQYTIFKTKQKALDKPTIDVDISWNLVQNMLVINLEEIFVRHYANENFIGENQRLAWKDILNSCLNP
jgi:hypothetical protein